MLPVLIARPTTACFLGTLFSTDRDVMVDPVSLISLVTDRTASVGSGSKASRIFPIAEAYAGTRVPVLIEAQVLSRRHAEQYQHVASVAHTQVDRLASCGGERIEQGADGREAEGVGCSGAQWAEGDAKPIPLGQRVVGGNLHCTEPSRGGGR